MGEIVDLDTIALDDDHLDSTLLVLYVHHSLECPRGPILGYHTVVNTSCRRLAASTRPA